MVGVGNYTHPCLGMLPLPRKTKEASKGYYLLVLTIYTKDVREIKDEARTLRKAWLDLQDLDTSLQFIRPWISVSSTHGRALPSNPCRH